MEGSLFIFQRVSITWVGTQYYVRLLLDTEFFSEEIKVVNELKQSILRN